RSAHPPLQRLPSMCAHCRRWRRSRHRTRWPSCHCRVPSRANSCSTWPSCRTPRASSCTAPWRRSRKSPGTRRRHRNPSSGWSRSPGAHPPALAVQGRQPAKAKQLSCSWWISGWMQWLVGIASRKGALEAGLKAIPWRWMQVALARLQAFARFESSFDFPAAVEIVGRFAAIAEVDFQLVDLQRVRRVSGLEPVAEAVRAPDLVTTVIHLDAPDRPAVLLDLLP